METALADPIAIPLLLDPALVDTDRVAVRINGVEQSDSFALWGRERRRSGFGHGRFGDAVFGRGHGPGFGIGPFGLGAMGRGVGVTTHRTAASFPAGDYLVACRATDGLGNAGPWGGDGYVAHRPAPPAPTDAALSGWTLTWSWSPDDG